MAKQIPWYRTIGGKLIGMAGLLLVVTFLLLVGNLYTLWDVQGDANWVVYSGDARLTAFQLLYQANQSFEDAGEHRVPAEELFKTKKDAEERLVRLRDGYPARGIPPTTEAEQLANLQRREDIWRREIGPLLEEITKKKTRAEAKSSLVSLESSVRHLMDVGNEGANLELASSQRKIRQLQIALGAFFVFTLMLFALFFWVTRSIGSRTRSLAATAERIAGGEMTLSAHVSGGDEVAALGETFDVMTAKLRANIESEQRRRARIEQLLDTIREAVSQLTAASEEILAGTTQQASGAREQAAAVSQTVATVDEVTQTADQTAQRARGLGDAVQRTQETGRTSRKVVEDSIAALERVREQVEATAENILALAEQAQAIGEIIAAVSDVAEQTNLLALNAAIEASRAGEHGKGFAVVAGEVKALADQSKKATGQVRQILGEIQKATNGAVLSMEEVTKGVNTAGRVATQSGDAIRALTDTLSEASQAMQQIVASAGQQAQGVAQIHQAMKNIDQAARQNLTSVRQTEQAAKNLTDLGGRLAALSKE